MNAVNILYGWMCHHYKVKVDRKERLPIKLFIASCTDQFGKKNGTVIKNCHRKLATALTIVPRPNYELR